MPDQSAWWTWRSGGAALLLAATALLAARLKARYAASGRARTAVAMAWIAGAMAAFLWLRLCPFGPERPFFI